MLGEAFSATVVMLDSIDWLCFVLTFLDDQWLGKLRLSPPSGFF
jgi:hypothetical protein